MSDLYFHDSISIGGKEEKTIVNDNTGERQPKITKKR